MTPEAQVGILALIILVVGPTLSILAYRKGWL
jgi:hypothetical protein